MVSHFRQYAPVTAGALLAYPRRYEQDKQGLLFLAPANDQTALRDTFILLSVRWAGIKVVISLAVVRLVYFEVCCQAA